MIKIKWKDLSLGDKILNIVIGSIQGFYIVIGVWATIELFIEWYIKYCL